MRRCSEKTTKDRVLFVSKLNNVSCRKIGIFLHLSDLSKTTVGMRRTSNGRFGKMSALLAGHIFCYFRGVGSR